MAGIMIIAAEMTFMGIRFTEVSFSTLVDPKGTGRGEAAFLIHAFNSFRFFAFCERRIFSTPYSHADCRVAVGAPASIGIVQEGVSVFHAQMAPVSSASPREPAEVGAGGWEGPVFLPSNRGGVSAEGRLFFGRVSGPTRTYPYDSGADEISLASSPAEGIFRMLVDSRFTGEQWAVRDDATHGKSKTYRRSDLSADDPR